MYTFLTYIPNLTGETKELIAAVGCNELGTLPAVRGFSWSWFYVRFFDNTWSCSCKIGQKTYFCKHIMAVKLNVRYQGRQMPQAQRLNLKRKRGRPEKIGSALSRV